MNNEPIDTILARLSRSSSDEHAWHDLFERLWPFVIGLTRRGLGKGLRGVEAEDIAQEVFLDLARYWNARPSERPEDEEAIRRLLTVLCEHALSDSFRRAYRDKRDVRRE